MSNDMTYPVSGELLLCEAIREGRFGDIIRPNISFPAAIAYSVASDYYDDGGAVVLDADVSVMLHRVILANEMLFALFVLDKVEFNSLMDRVRLSVVSSNFKDMADAGLDTVFDSALANFCNRFEYNIHKVPFPDELMDNTVNLYCSQYN